MNQKTFASLCAAVVLGTLSLVGVTVTGAAAEGEVDCRIPSQCSGAVSTKAGPVEETAQVEVGCSGTSTRCDGSVEGDVGAGSTDGSGSVDGTCKVTSLDCDAEATLTPPPPPTETP